jgi:type VI secretion system protein ImpF
MPRSDYEPNITPSILDRLLDNEPGVSREPATSRIQDLKSLERAVARDLEALLNTKRETLEELPQEFFDVNRSLITYGLPDFTSLSLLSQDDRNKIRRAIENAVATFEPRLQRVRVTIEAPREKDRGLRFRLDGQLRVEPTPEPVTFDAFLQINTHEYVVTGQD